MTIQGVEARRTGQALAASQFPFHTRQTLGLATSCTVDKLLSTGDTGSIVKGEGILRALAHAYVVKEIVEGGAAGACCAIAEGAV